MKGGLEREYGLGKEGDRKEEDRRKFDWAEKLAVMVTRGRP